MQLHGRQPRHINESHDPATLLAICPAGCSALAAQPSMSWRTWSSNERDTAAAVSAVCVHGPRANFLYWDREPGPRPRAIRRCHKLRHLGQFIARRVRRNLIIQLYVYVYVYMRLPTDIWIWQTISTPILHVICKNELGSPRSRPRCRRHHKADLPAYNLACT